MSIKVEEVTKQYGSQRALDQVSFEISKGEIVGFLGPNGAGKSTMMKIICCYLPATEGKVTVCEKDVQQNEQDIKNLIGYLPEHNPLYLDLYVKEFLDFICGVHGIKKNKKERIEEVIALTGLEKEQNKKIGALSKGYRQRVGIAQAIIHDPQVLILDEPTTGLDPNQIVEIRELIKNIGKEKTVMLSTHIMQEVEAICTRAIIINRGQIVADESVENLKALNSKLVFDIEFESDFDVQHLSGIEDIIEIKKISSKHYEIQCVHDRVRKEIAQIAIRENNMVVQINKKSVSLEHIFQHLTQ